VEAAQEAIVASDCPLAGLQLSQAGGMVTVHPIQVMKRAYGI